MRFLFTVLLICVLLSPASAIAAEIAAEPADPQLTPAETDGLTPPPADETAQPAEDTDPEPESSLAAIDAFPEELAALLTAQEAATQELAGLHSLLVEVWQHVRFWAVAGLAFWFSKKSWQGVT